MKSPETMSEAHTHRDAESLLAHADFLRALVSRLVADESTADDILQATWLSALKHPPRAGGSVRAWLWRVAQNHVRQMRRGDGRRSAREHDVRRPAQVPSAADIVARESARRTVVDAVVGLSDPYRQVILLRFYEDLPPRKVARALGIPVETVRTRTRRGLAQLRTQLDSEYGDERQDWTLALLPLLLRPSAPSLISGTTVALCATALAAACGLLLGWSALADRLATAPAAARPSPVALVQPPAPVAARPASAGPTHRVAAPGARPGPAPRPTAAPGARAAPTARLSGRVVDSTGAPVIGAEVLGFAGARPTLRQDSSGTPTSTPVARTLSDPDGQFELAGLPLDFYLRAQRGDLVSVAGLVGTLPAAGALSDVELVVTPGLSLRGRVVTPDGTPVPDCQIDLRTQARRGYVRPTAHADLITGAMAVFATTTDAQGEFQLRHLPAAKHRLRARHPDFAPGEADVLPGSPTLTAPLVLELPAGARSRVVVTDEQGQPLQGCSLEWLADMDQISARAHTDTRGQALLPAVPVESRGHVLARHRDLAPTYSPALVAGGTVRLRLAPAREISGTVVDEEGLPINGAHVEVRAGGWSEDDEFPAEPRAHQARGAVRTDAEGRFRVGGLGDGVHHLTATVPESRVPGATGVGTPGHEPVHLVARGSGPGTVPLRGRVRAARTAAPIEAFGLSARGPGDAVLSEVIESPDGEFALELPALADGTAGRWTLVLRADGFAPRDLGTREFTATSTPLEVQLFESRDLHLVLRDASDQPVANARVVISDMRGRPVTAKMSAGVWMDSILVGPSGEVRLRELPAQQLKLEVRVPDLPRLPQYEVDLSSAQAPDTRELRLPCDLSSPRRSVAVELRGDPHRVPLRFEVRDEHGTLVAGWTVRHDERGDLHISKPLRHLVLRYDQAGYLTHRGLARPAADALTLDFGAQLVESDAAHVLFRARLPLEPCQVTVTVAGGSSASAHLPREAASLTLELP